MKGINLKGLFKPETLKTGLKTVARVAENNAPAIAAGIAIAGMFAAVIAAGKAGPEVKERLEQAHIAKNEKALAERMSPENFSDETPIIELTWKEKAPIYLKGYLKTLILMLLSASCMIGSVYFGNKQKAALTVLLTAAESKIMDIENATKAVVGDKQFDKIKGALIDNQVESHPPIAGGIADTSTGKTLCLEPIFGTYYWADISAVKKAYADFYDMYIHSQQVYMEDLYNLLKIPASYLPKIANDLMFVYDLDEGIEHKPEYSPHSIATTLDGVEHVVYVMDMTNPKTYDQLKAEAYAKRQFRNWRNS